MHRPNVQIISRNGKKQFAVVPYGEFKAMQQRLNDAEDLMVLRAAKKAESRKPTLSLKDVRKKLGL